MNFGLNGKVALVTGGGQGVGKQICIDLANEGAYVVVNDLVLERAQEVAHEIHQTGGKAVAIQADITKYDDVLSMVSKATEHFGNSISVLVNNAGIIPERIPIKLEMNKPVTMFFIERTNGKASCGMRVNKTTKPMPTSPPIKLKNTASNKN